jgi:hypothetical protein
VLSYLHFFILFLLKLLFIENIAKCKQENVKLLTISKVVQLISDKSAHCDNDARNPRCDGTKFRAGKRFGRKGKNNSGSKRTNFKDGLVTVVLKK